MTVSPLKKCRNVITVTDINKENKKIQKEIRYKENSKKE